MAQLQSQTEKLEMFQQAILEKAMAEKAEIHRATEEQKQDELSKEENRLLEEIYRKIQTQISEIKTVSVKEISRETTQIKKQLYQQREQYLIKLLADARIMLSEFVNSGDYEAFLLGRLAKLAKEYPYPGSVLRMREADMGYAVRAKEIYGDCTVIADDENIAIGGVILLNTQKGIEVDYSLDAALAEQRGWFYTNSNFNFEETGETA